MDPTAAISAARRALLEGFRWDGGHADVWRVFEDGDRFSSIIHGAAEMAAAYAPTKIVGIESRGFLLGGAVAAELGIGFHAVRKSDGMLPGAKRSVDAAPDYRGRSHHLRMRSTLEPTDRVVLVDDWVERASQAAAAKQLVEAMGARWSAVVALVDDRGAASADIGPVASLVSSSELGPSA